MPDLRKGYTFTGTSPNNSVTAEKLNALVDGATIQPGFYTERSESLSAGDADWLLLYSSTEGAFQKIRKANLISAGVAPAGFVNLHLTNNAAAPGSQIDVTAGELVLRSAAGQVRHVSAFSATLDAAAWSGVPVANGRDFATLAADSWCYAWAISDGTNDRLLLSASATSPALPSGYPYRALLSAVRLDHTIAFNRFVQRDREVVIEVASKAGDANAFANPKTGATPVEFTNASCDALKTFQAADLSPCIPPLATSIRGMIGQATDSGGATYTYAIAARGTGAIDGSNVPTDALGLQILATHAAAGATQMYGFYSAAPFELLLETPQTLFWTASAGAARHNLRIHGFTLGV